MNALTHLFHIISSSLLIPTELALLIALAFTLYNLGEVTRERLSRRRGSKFLRDVESYLERRDWNATTSALANAPRLRVATQLATLATLRDDDALLDKRLAEFEIEAKLRCGRSERLAKMGPALGLMGTLIPMGPALLGLSQGDLASLATNLVVAFSTTVVGLLIALTASWNASTQKLWASRDFALLNFAVERALESRATSSEDDAK